MAIVDMRPNERDSSSNMRVRLIHQIFELVHATDLCATISRTGSNCYSTYEISQKLLFSLSRGMPKLGLRPFGLPHVISMRLNAVVRDLQDRRTQNLGIKLRINKRRRVSKKLQVPTSTGALEVMCEIVKVVGGFPGTSSSSLCWTVICNVAKLETLRIIAHA